MKSKPIVSVIINCYNGEEYLRGAIDSVINQTFSNWELIFWDNQSTDSTAQIVGGYQDDRIRYFYAPKHTPLGEARNYAIDKSDGDYISFLDSDDEWFPDFLNVAINYLELRNECVGFYSNTYFMKNKVKSISNFDMKGLRTIRDIITNYQIDVSACVLRSNVIFNNNIRFNKEYQMIEDYDFFINVAVYGDYYYDDQPLAQTHIHFSETYRKRRRWYYEYSSFKEYAASLQKRDIIDEACIKAIDDKIQESRLGLFIDENRRLDYLFHFFKHFRLLHKGWKQLLFVIIGRDLFIYVEKRRLGSV